MIEMKCPACSAGGRIPRDKKNTRLVCKKCLAVFHLSPSGTPVLGEPPVRQGKPEGKGARAESGGGRRDRAGRVSSRDRREDFPRSSCRESPGRQPGSPRPSSW